MSQETPYDERSKKTRQCDNNTVKKTVMATFPGTMMRVRLHKRKKIVLGIRVLHLQLYHTDKA